MKSIVQLLFLIMLSHILTAQYRSTGSKTPPVKTYFEKQDEDMIIYADNDGWCPFTIIVKMELSNMKSDRGDLIEIVIPAKTYRQEVAKADVVDVYKASRFGFKNTYLMGNTLETPNHDAVYLLPYKKGSSYNMSQGYNGKFSHQGKKALDFTMPTGTPICAARDGIVIEVVNEYSKGCPEPKCLEMANSITIYHEDGTFAQYSHLKKNGSIVQPGDQVEAGAVIGYSGDTGYSSGPHLHFEVYYYDGTEQVSVATPFDIGLKKPVLLEEHTFYTAQ